MHLHADDHPTPNAELRRLVEVHRAYDHLEASEELQLEGDAAGVSRERAAALAAGPGLVEVRYWAAIGLAGEGRIDEARELIAPAFAANPGWRELLVRLQDHDLLDVPSDAARALLADPPR
jgi:hypothetical protein